MIKTLAKAQQQERVKFRVPRSVQDAIPIRRIWSDGIFLCGNQYSKTWSFTDINYAIAGKTSLGTVSKPRSMINTGNVEKMPGKMMAHGVSSRPNWRNIR